MSITLPRVGWEDGTLVNPAKVTVNGTVYEVTPEEYSGSTPLSAENLKEMEDNTENTINGLYDDATTLLDWTAMGNSSSNTYNLSGNISDYKFLYIMFSKTNDNTGNSCTQLVLSKLFKNIHSSKSLTLFEDFADSNYNIRCSYKTETSIGAWGSTQISPKYIKIIGLN